MTPRIGSDLSVPVSASDHVRGNPHAQVTIVAYGDFECPVCRAAEPGLRMLLDAHPEMIQLVFRHYPMESVHPHVLMAAEAAEAASAQFSMTR
jgi:protein-disulfide isomerase